jgi:hypothetical protein
MCRDSDEDTEHMIHMLHEGEYDALILDTPVMQHIVGTDDHCSYFLVGDSFDAFSVALAFPPDANQTVILEFSTSMVRKQVS